MDSSVPQPAFWLLQLPDPCLLAVLRCCADDPRSLFSAARAHSRLHQAAVLAASSIRTIVRHQQHADSVRLYLSKYGQKIDSIHLGREGYAAVGMRQLPHQLQGLSSLSFSSFELQLQPGGGFQGVLRAGLPLKQLRLTHCRLLDGEVGLAAALSLLPELQHLSHSGNHPNYAHGSRFPSSVLQALPQLTYLELVHCGFPDGDQGRLGHLQGLIRLQDLRLHYQGTHTLQADVLWGLQQLTQLRLRGSCWGVSMFEPGILAGRTQLQHLAVVLYDIVGGSAGTAQLLSHLQHLQQLTHLDLWNTLPRRYQLTSPAAYSALTASSKLRHLNISHCAMPAGVWQHVFPAGRQLPHLRVLDISRVRNLAGPAPAPAAAPEGSRLVSCCPGLQSLQMHGLQYSLELLAALTGLSSLQKLGLEPAGRSSEGLEVVWQLTGLRELDLMDPSKDGRLLLQLTQLKQLTHLEYECKGRLEGLCFLSEEAPGKPVWQTLWQYLDRRDAAAAQQAAAALAE